MRSLLISGLILCLALPACAALTINNDLGATNVSASRAYLTATITATGAANVNVIFYWGATNATTNAGSWAHATMPSTNLYGTGTVSAVIYSIQPTNTYWYRAYAYNGTTEYAWAASSTNFTTPDNTPTSTLTIAGTHLSYSNWIFKNWATLRISNDIASAAAVSAISNDYVSKSGDTMTGDLVVKKSGYAGVTVESSSVPMARLGYDGTYIGQIVLWYQAVSNVLSAGDVGVGFNFSTGAVFAGDVVMSGRMITNATFYGDGKGLTNISAAVLGTATSFVQKVGDTMTGDLTAPGLIANNTNVGESVRVSVSQPAGATVVKILVSSDDSPAQTPQLLFGLDVGPTGTVWHSLNDGTGGGLDADLLDGSHASEFVQTNVISEYVLKSTGTLGTNATTVAVGLNASAEEDDVSVGYNANAYVQSVAIGRNANGREKGTSVGAYSKALTNGTAFGRFSIGNNYGVSIGADAVGTNKSVAIGAYARAYEQSIAIGYAATNDIPDSALIRGALYLDGATGLFTRASFGDGTWIPNSTMSAASNHVIYGDCTFNNTAWEDLRFPLESLTTGGASAPEIDDDGGPGGNLLCVLFDDSTDEYLFGRAQLPHARKDGTDLHPHVHYRPTTTSTGDVCWFLTYTWANIGSNFPAPSTITWTNAISNEQWKHKMASSHVQISAPGGSEGSAMLDFQIGRDANNPGDTFVGDLDMLEFDIHYEVNKIGSFDETP